MDHAQLTKKLVHPAGAVVPTRLAFDDLVAIVLGRGDLAEDVRGINASLALIQQTRGGGWPTEPVTEEYDYVDLVWHECEFREGYSYSYVVRSASGGYLGCCYLYPMGRRTALTAELLGHDVDVSWWVTTDAYARGYYRKLHDALRHWLATDFRYWKPYFSNAQIPA